MYNMKPGHLARYIVQLDAVMEALSAAVPTKCGHGTWDTLFADTTTQKTVDKAYLLARLFDRPLLHHPTEDACNLAIEDLHAFADVLRECIKIELDNVTRRPGRSSAL